MIARKAWDCLVVGAGPAGAVTALLLARGGRHVALIDAAHFPRQKVCGEYLSGTAWQLLDALGLGDLRHEAAGLSGMCLDVAGGRSARLAFDPALAAPAALSRYLFDAALVDAARAAGVDVFEGFRVKQVLVDGRVSGVVAASVKDPRQQETFLAPLVVAADGRRSQIVRETGSTTRGRSSLVGFKAHADGPMPEGSETTLVMHSLPDGYIGVCPVEGGAINVCGVMPPERLRDARGNLAQAIRSWVDECNPRSATPHLTIRQEPTGWHTMPEVSIQRSRPHTPGVLYVGDAMGTIEPLTGQGMTMALAAARLAADHLLAGGAAVEPSGQLAYERAWQAQFATTIRSSRWMGWLLRHPRLLSTMIAAGDHVPGLLPGLLGAIHRRSLVPATSQSSA